MRGNRRGSGRGTRRATRRHGSRRWRAHRPGSRLGCSASPPSAYPPPVQSVLDAGTVEHPGDETVAVRPGPVTIALAVRINFGCREHRGDACRLLAGPLGRDARGSAADDGVQRLQIAVHMTDAGAAGVLRLPYFPAMASAGVVRDHEPVVHRDGADERQRRVTKLDFQMRIALAVLCFILMTAASAQEWPTKAVRIIV